MYRTVIVNLKDRDDQALRGVLWRSSSQWITLKRAEVLTVGQEPRVADGDVIIDRRNIEFLQALP